MTAVTAEVKAGDKPAKAPAKKDDAAPKKKK